MSDVCTPTAIEWLYHPIICKYVKYAYRFFSQKMEANEPEKKMPSTAAKAMILSPKVAVVEPIHFNAHSAFFFTQGTVKRTILHRRVQFIPHGPPPLVVCLKDPYMFQWHWRGTPSLLDHGCRYQSINCTSLSGCSQWLSEIHRSTLPQRPGPQHWIAPPGSHWRYHHWQQRMPTHAWWSVALQAEKNKSIVMCNSVGNQHHLAQCIYAYKLNVIITRIFGSPYFNIP